VVRAILRRKSGMTLAADDSRADNLDALELHQDVLGRLWARLADDITDLKGYAASVTHNVWSDHLRRKYPRRTSLKNRLRYFLGHQHRYAIWEDGDGELLGGLRSWQLAGRERRPPPAGSHESGWLPPGSVPRKSLERYASEDWDRLLGALFARLNAPIAVDELVALVVGLIGLEEDEHESLTDAEGEDRSASLADPEGRRPDREAEQRSQLSALWQAVQRLRADCRRAYLLNIPGPGKSRGDIEVFVLQGIATIADIGAAVGLEAEHYGVARKLLELGPARRARPGVAPDEFPLLYKHLPLSDAVIAEILKLQPQQVINLRMLALRELARALEGPRR